MYKRLTGARKWKIRFLLIYIEKLKLLQRLKRHCKVIYGSDTEYEVLQERSKVYATYLKRMACGCKAQLANEKPYPHVLQYISYISDDFIDYIDDKFKRPLYMATY